MTGDPLPGWLQTPAKQAIVEFAAAATELGGYRIESLLRRGGMGVVYEGIDKTTSERVAIKVVQASSAQQLDALQRFVREAASVATIRHPAVVRMLHVGITE